MASETAVAKDGQFILVCLLPDVCLTPSKSGKPVPYPVTHTMDLSEQCSDNVYFAGKAAYLHDASYVDGVTGDTAGQGGGVMSHVNAKMSHSIDKSQSVFINGRPMVRTGDKVWMNQKKPPASAEAATAQREEATAAKAARYHCRKGQIAAGKQSTDPAVREAAKRFENNNHLVEQAKLAQDVYTPGDAPPPGWNNISNDPAALAKYGLKSSDLSITRQNFGAQVYTPNPAVFGNDFSSQLVFKGTGPTSLQDWDNNFAQGINMHSDYYERAVNIGISIEGSSGLEIVGHSLGGGLADAASGASGLPATTFNAAGLNAHTVEKYGGTVHTPEINNYHVAGEILAGVQEQSLGSTLVAAGIGRLVGGPKGAVVGALAKIGLSALMPDARGIQHPLQGSGMNPVDRHGMDQVVSAIEEQKSADQKTLQHATGKSCG